MRSTDEIRKNGMEYNAKTIESLVFHGRRKHGMMKPIICKIVFRMCSDIVAKHISRYERIVNNRFGIFIFEETELVNDFYLVLMECLGVYKRDIENYDPLVENKKKGGWKWDPNQTTFGIYYNKALSMRVTRITGQKKYFNPKARMISLNDDTKNTSYLANHIPEPTSKSSVPGTHFDFWSDLGNVGLYGLELEVLKNRYNLEELEDIDAKCTKGDFLRRRGVASSKYDELLKSAKEKMKIYYEEQKHFPND